ncbi:MAG: cobyrinate a,c-diamide synthase [Nitrospirae bacterium]|nr:cobyrinate a,c-diamide synthase [Nitrospirota bacterium]
MTQLLTCSIPRIVISALRGSSGKTLLSLSLIALWRKRGLKVTPFKKGPDYIDAGWLAKVSGGHCFNLDLFMMKPEQALQSFISHTCNFHEHIIKESTEEGKNPPTPPFSKGGQIDSPLWQRGVRGDFTRKKFSGQIALIEGNRGLYDGADSSGTYSTAELAKLLNAPVLLVVDCTKATSTVSAMILGCQRLDPKVKIRGVVLNNISTERQELIIREAIEKNCRIPVLGVIPKFKKDLFPERHMGLTPFHEHLEVEKSISTIAELSSKYLDIDAIWKIAKGAPPLKTVTSYKLQVTSYKKAVTSNKLRVTSKENYTNSLVKTRHSSLPLDSLLVTCYSSLKIGVIRDSAFQFYYPENIEELKKRGARIIEINALRDKKLSELDALYIGGGFPETHAKELAQNKSFRKSLHNAIESGLPVYAECGGLMYLGESLILHNKTYPMVGAFPLIFGVEKKPRAHGYTILEVAKKNPYFSKNLVLKGHEFHYSRVLKMDKTPISLRFTKENENIIRKIPLYPPFPKGDNFPLSREVRGVYPPLWKRGGRGDFIKLFPSQTDNIYFAFKMKRGQGIVDKMDGLCYKNVLATYTHLHALGAREWVEGLIRCAMKFKTYV